MEEKSKKPQFDSFLGGNVEVPDSLPVQRIIKSRIDEIEALTQLIEMPSTNIMMAKQFPKHLRRRAMSQNPKRIPKRLRDEHINMREKSGIRETPLKRPRRKYRRRPSNLLDEYNRRQKKHVWLETHIWHAKRFHMVEKWGYKLPSHPNDRSFRACYRASSKYCLIQDVSYYCCIELTGNIDELLNGLNNHASKDNGLTFSSSYIQSGSYEGSIVFYSSNKYPKGAIGEIKYFWLAPNEITNIRTLWLWCHPSLHKQVLDELVETFALELEEPMILDDEESQQTNQTKNVEDKKLLLRNVPYVKTPKYSSKSNSLKMVLLKDTLNRFRLIGPQSQALITQAFVPVDLSKRTNDDCFTKLYNNGHKLNHDSQHKFWHQMKNVSSPGQLPRHLILSSVVIDPRFTLPSNRKKAESCIEGFDFQSIQSTDPLLSWSPIWSSAVRDEISKNQLSMHQLNQIRSDKLVPGLELESKDVNINNLPAIPIILIQEPGEENKLKPLGYGCGWEIIVPSGYGMAVWLALSFHGGRSGGLQEERNVLRERGRLFFPPDTLAGEMEEKTKRNEDTERYFALPPAKRQNYIKLGIPTPFYCPWKILINDWVGSESFFMLRHKAKLQKLQDKIKDPKKTMSYESNDREALINVLVTLKDKGTLGNNAIICIPNNEDYMKLKEDRTFSGPTEPHHNDKFETKRKTVRTEHKSLLKRLSRKRRIDKQNKIITDSNNSEHIVDEYNKVIRDLWLPECVSIKDHCSRTIIGFVSDGDFSFTNAKGAGIGFVSFEGLLFLLKRISESYAQKYLILVRNTNTDQYRFAQLNIVI